MSDVTSDDFQNRADAFLSSGNRAAIVAIFKHAAQEGAERVKIVWDQDGENPEGGQFYYGELYLDGNKDPAGRRLVSRAGYALSLFQDEVLRFESLRAAPVSFPLAALNVTGGTFLAISRTDPRGEQREMEVSLRDNHRALLAARL